MSDITRGHTFVSGEVVEAQSLNDLVSNAVVAPTLISQKVLKDPAALSDRILIEDSGTLKGITLQQIIDLVSPIIKGQAVPVGTVCDFAGPNAPENWMFCGGQLVSRDAFADLFAVIGTVYSAGDGTSTFGLPDYSCCVLAGKADMSGTTNPALGTMSGHVLGSFGGAQVHTLSVNEMPAHGHTIPDHTHSASVFAAQVNLAGSARGGTGTFSVDNGILTVAVQGSGALSATAAGGNQYHNNLQPTKIANKIIKVLNA